MQALISTLQLFLKKKDLNPKKKFKDLSRTKYISNKIKVLVEEFTT